MIINVLHIGKTGGSYFFSFVKKNSIENNFKFHGHHVTASDLNNEPYIVILRDPASRFYSSFYSRKRMGRPKYFRPWNFYELIFFTLYKNCDTLINQMKNNNKLALYLCKKVRHLKSKQVEWMNDPKNPPLMILKQETLEHDIDILMNLLNIKQYNHLSRRVHSNHIPYKNININKDFIRKLYDEDYKIWSKN